MTSLIVWCVSLVVILLVTVVLAETKFGFDGKNGQILKRGRGKQFDRLADGIIALAVMLHSFVVLFLLLSSESWLFSLMAAAFRDSSPDFVYYFAIPIAVFFYWCLVFLIYSLVYHLVSKFRYKYLIEEKKKFWKKTI